MFPPIEACTFLLLPWIFRGGVRNAVSEMIRTSRSTILYMYVIHRPTSLMSETDLCLVILYINRASPCANAIYFLWGSLEVAYVLLSQGCSQTPTYCQKRHIWYISKVYAHVFWETDWGSVVLAQDSKGARSLRSGQLRPLVYHVHAIVGVRRDKSILRASYHANENRQGKYQRVPA